MLRAHGMLQRALVSLLLCPSSCCLQLRVAPTQHCRISTRGCPAAAAARAAHVCMQAPPPQPPQPPPPAVPLPAWVSSVNSALETSATATLLAFVALDMAGATALLGAICALRVSVGADFMLALAIAKALRGPRLALDTSLAALLGRTFPALRAVRLSLLFDEVAASWAAVASGFSEGRAEAAGKAASVEASGLPPGFTPRPGKREAAQLAAGRLVSEHGLAYMAAKNIVGPASTLTLTLTLNPNPNPNPSPSPSPNPSPDPSPSPNPNPNPNPNPGRPRLHAARAGGAALRRPRAGGDGVADAAAPRHRRPRGRARRPDGAGRDPLLGTLPAGRPGGGGARAAAGGARSEQIVFLLNPIFTL